MKYHADLEYLDLLRRVMDSGRDRKDRTGTGTRSIFGAQMRFDLRHGFPLLTTKKVHFSSIVHELIWFLSGGTNVHYLQKNNVTIWDEWATREECAKFGRLAGELGPIYGHQWRNFGASKYMNDGFDQIEWVIREIKRNPNSRRLIVTGWNPKEAEQVSLPPCHTMFQFYVEHGELSCQLYQRSADMFLGVPFNIASYALLTEMVAQVCDLHPGDLVHTLGDVHVYHNHFEQAELQLTRIPYPSPQIVLNPDVRHIDDFVFGDVRLDDYHHHPAIKAPVSV